MHFKSLTTLAVALTFMPDAFALPSGSTTTPSIPATIGVFKYLACWSDTVQLRTLVAKFDSAVMTNELCATYCAGYAYFGTEYTSECFCGNTLTAGSTATTDGRCNMPCGGDSTEMCGGPNGLTLYGNPALIPGLASSSTATTKKTTSSTSSSKPRTTSTSSTKTTAKTTSSSTSSSKSSTTSKSSTKSSTTSTTSAKPTTTSTTSAKPSSSSTTSAAPAATTALVNGLYAYQGCYQDGYSARGLNGPTFQGVGMTLESCATFCTGYTYFSVENGGECYCGYTIQLTSPPATGCNMACYGNTAEICGGFSRMSVYGVPALIAAAKPVNGYVYQGCYLDGYSARGLTGPQLRSATLNLETCQTFCAGYTYFGVENGYECYCGNTIEPSSAPNFGCNMACAGNSGEICGGFSHIGIYGNPAAIAATPPAVYGLYAYQGCYTDGFSARGLTGPVLQGATVSLEACANFCGGYIYFGVENSSECYCGNSIAQTSVMVPTSNGCNMPCPANNQEICGGFSRMSVFAYPPLVLNPGNPGPL